MLWVALAVMTCVAAAFVLWPLLSGRMPHNEAQSEVSFYSAQLAEITRDVERGQLPATEAAAVRAETGRRLLAASNASSNGPGRGSRSRQRIAAVLAVLAIPAISASVYAKFGRPGLPDAPVAGRPQQAQQAQGDTAAPDPVQTAILRVEKELAANPDNLKAWAALAPVYLRLGRYDDAVIAARNVLRLQGEDGTLRANLGEALVAANGGKVTDEARKEFDQSLKDTPDNVMAKFYIGLATEQAGDIKKAIETYEPLIALSQDHPTWQRIIQSRIDTLKGSDAPKDAAGMVPGNAATSAAPPKAGADQQDMIKAMVARLADRLAASGGSGDEWLRLVRAYTVLGQPDKAKEALASARKALSADAPALANLDALAKELNINQ